MFKGCLALAELSQVHSDSLSIAVQASAEGGPERVKGTVLLNCAGGMNTKVRALMLALTYSVPSRISCKPLHLSRLAASQCIYRYDGQIQGVGPAFS